MNKGKKVLWLAHRHELLEQAKSTFADKLAFNDIFETKTSFNYRIISGIHDKPINIRPSDDLIISSKDSLNTGFNHLYNNWINGNTEEIFLVIDEAHHAPAKTYRKLIQNIQENVSRFQMLGLTATPFGSVIEDYSSKELKKVFDKHISKDEATVRTDGWSGYDPIGKEYKMERIKSNKGKNFPNMHTLIMNFKSWLRGIYHKCSERHIQAYLDEFFYRFNRRNFGDNRFHNLIVRMVQTKPMFVKTFTT